MLQNCGDTQNLFAKSIPVTIKNGFTNQCRKCTLFLTVEWKEASAAGTKKELLISLTDSNDPFFLHHLHLSEEDFQVLKSNQGVLVDFTAFPQQLINFMETCIAEEDKASPAFILVFNTSDSLGNISPTSQLDVVQTNEFRHLIHLTLKFIAATDSSMKQYLALTLKKLKEEKHQLESRLSYLEQDSRSRLSACHASLEQKSQELEKLRNELRVQLTEKDSAHTRELREEREKLENKQREIELRCEREKKEKEYHYDKNIQQLEKRVSTLDLLNKELNDQIRQRDTTIQELRSCKSALQDELGRSKKVLQDCKEKNQELQSELKQKLSEVSLQKVRIEDLDQNAAYVKQMMNKLQEQFEKNLQHERILEADYSELQKEFQDNKKVIKKQQVDIDKANEVIAKLQRQIQDTHEELKENHSHVSGLKRIISDKDKSIRMLQKEIKDCNQNLRERNGKVEHFSASIASLQGKINCLEKEIKSRDNVIKYLNRQIADNIQPQYVPPSHQDQSSPIIEKRNPSGDAGVVDRGQSPSTAVTEKPKTFAARRNTQGNNLSSSVAFGKSYRGCLLPK